MKTKVLLNKLAKRFPKRLAVHYHDHVGLMTSKLPEEVHKVVLCLDFDATIADQVLEIKPDIVFTHHPFIYGTRRNVFKWDPNKKILVERLEKEGLCIYSMHTNFDAGKGGMNDALTQALGLVNVHGSEKDPSIRIGELKEEMDVVSFAKMAKKAFKVDYSLLINAGKPTVKKVGIIGGGGSYMYTLAKDEGCDIYISGDAPHHKRREIVVNEFNYLDMPHEIEKIFIPTMKKILLDMDPSLEIIEIDHEKLPQVI